MTDERILDLFFARDENALTETDRSYGWKLELLAVNILGNHEDAEEAKNETYWRAWNTIPPERPLRFFAWLARVCRRYCLNVVRERSTKKRTASLISLTDELADCLPGRSIQEEIDARELASLISSFLIGQSEQIRKLFVRRYWYLDSIEELANIFHITKGKVKTDLYRTRKRLKEYLETEGFTV